MAFNIQTESAQIFEFPLTPRRRLDDGRTVPVAAPVMSANVVDQCWYHDEAVRIIPTTPEWPKSC